MSVRTCQRPGCGREISTSKRAGTRFCSTRCRVAAHRARRRAQREACPVPAEMLARPRWVNHLAKRPVNPATGAWASVNDPTTWGTHEAARARDSRHTGYVLGEGIGCIDLDHCLDEQGRPTQAATELLDFYAGSYVEVSPSGRGLHIWGTAPPRAGFRRTWKGQAVEFYSTGRYITVTGQVFRPGTLLPL